MNAPFSGKYLNVRNYIYIAFSCNWVSVCTAKLTENTV